MGARWGPGTGQSLRPSMTWSGESVLSRWEGGRDNLETHGGEECALEETWVGRGCRSLAGWEHWATGPGAGQVQQRPGIGWHCRWVAPSRAPFLMQQGPCTGTGTVVVCGMCYFLPCHQGHTHTKGQPQPALPSDQEPKGPGTHSPGWAQPSSPLRLHTSTLTSD